MFTVLPIPVVLDKLRSLGISSLMVEGGARVIDSFLQANLSTPCIESLIVTVAPTLVGASGVAYGATTPEGVKHPVSQTYLRYAQPATFNPLSCLGTTVTQFTPC